MRPVRVVVLGLSVVFLLSVPGRVQAQGSGDGFLFRAPQGEVSIRGGFNHAATGSDLFSFTTSQLTLNPARLQLGDVCHRRRRRAHRSG